MKSLLFLFFFSLFLVLSLSKFTPKGSDYFTSTWTSSELRGVSSEDSEYLRKWKENKHKEMINKDDKNMVFPRRMKKRDHRHGVSVVYEHSFDKQSSL